MNLDFGNLDLDVKTLKFGSGHFKYSDLEGTIHGGQPADGSIQGLLRFPLLEGSGRQVMVMIITDITIIKAHVEEQHINSIFHFFIVLCRLYVKNCYCRAGQDMHSSLTSCYK